VIIIVELMDDGIAHAPGNSQWTQVIAKAAPHQTVRLLGPARHIAALRADPNLTAHPNVRLEEIPVIAELRSRVNVATIKRFREEFSILRAELAAVPHDEPCLVVFAAATPTAVHAARLAGRLLRRRVEVQMVLHGFANEVEGWRSRNPLARRFDLRGLMDRPPPGVRFLVLERAIAAELGRIVPASAERIDVLPLPVNADEIDSAAVVPFGLPLKVALVGQTTPPKGIGPFLETARDFKARYGEAIEFHVVGRRFPDTDRAALSVLAREIPEEFMSRAEFRERLAPIHYVFLPLQPVYYRLSPSGALIDAITWLKPLIASDIPICADAFAEGGDIGYLCHDLPAMQAALHSIMQNPDGVRYAAQVEAMRRLRQRRLPCSLVPAYADIISRHYSFLSPVASRQEDGKPAP
jgi:hypothetical protein